MCVSLLTILILPAKVAEIKIDVDTLAGDQRHLTQIAFDDAVATARRDGFMPSDIQVYKYGTSTRYALSLRRNPDKRRWAVRSDLTTSQLEASNQLYRQDNYRLLDMETIPTLTANKHTALWISNTEELSWVSRTNLTRSTLAHVDDAQRNIGNRIIDIEMNWTATGMRYDGIWQRASQAEHVHYGLDHSSYQDLVNEYAQQNYRISDFESEKHPLANVTPLSG